MNKKKILKMFLEPDGERINRTSVILLISAISMLVLIPMSVKMKFAQVEHEETKARNSSMLTNGDVSVAQTNENVTKQLKAKSDEGMVSLNNKEANYNAMIGKNPLDTQESVLSVNSHSEQISNSANQEQVPPIVSNGNGAAQGDSLIQEKNSQKVDTLKRKYDALNSPITLGDKTNKQIASEAKSQSMTSQNSNITNEQLNATSSLSKTNSIGGIAGNLPQIDDDQNKQNEKRSFLENAQGGNAEETINPSKVQLQASKYLLVAGDFIPAIMISGLNTDTPGQIIAQVKENLYDTVHAKYLLIPKGSRLVGMYDSKVAYLQNRILVAWKRVIFPDGKSYLLNGMPGTDLAGYSGFYNPEGVDNHYWQIYGSSFILGVITGGMQYSQNNTNSNVQVGGLNVTNPSIGQTMAGSLGQQLGQTGTSQVQKNINVQPTLTIPPGYEFNIMITADLVLEPYTNNYK